MANQSYIMTLKRAAEAAAAAKIAAEQAAVKKAAEAAAVKKAAEESTMNFGREGRRPRFEHVLLIVTRFRADKVLTLHSAYRPHFWDVVFLGAMGEMNAEEASNLTQQGFQVDDCSKSIDRAKMNVD